MDTPAQVTRTQMLADADAILYAFSTDYKRMAE